MKKNLALASLMLVGTFASAMDVNYFVAAGAGKGYETVKIEISSLNYTEKASDNAGVGVIEGGVLLDNQHRIGLEYAKYNTDAGSSMYSVGLGYEYLIDFGSKLKPFVGASYNIVKYSSDSYSDSGVTIDASNLTANALMARVGAQYDFNKHFYVNASYDYALTVSGDTDIGVTIGGTYYPNTVNMEVDKLSKFQFLVGYNF